MSFPQIVFHRYRPGTLLNASGEDVLSFLQGQFTNDLRQGPGSCVYGLWLNQKGKVVADSHVLRTAEAAFSLFSVDCPAASLQSRLEEYIVADDVSVIDETPASFALAAAGPGSREALQQVLSLSLEDGTFVRGGGLTVIRGRRCAADSFECWGAAEAVEALAERLRQAGGVERSREEMDRVRIEDGVPAVPDDIGPADLPNEGGLEATAISYTKGCYLGQEVMARLKNLGQVRRRLTVVRGREGEIPSRAPLYQGTTKVGETRSTASVGPDSLAFAMLSLVSLDPASGLSLAPGGAPSIEVVRHG
jgi:folate-binding protein YgfZ